MKNGLNRKLAWGNIRKNYRFFVPRILTEVGLLACFYIIFNLACDRRLSQVKGGTYLPAFMLMGTIIIGLLSVVLMLYTNSFLMKQRKREFGLYNVLGMEKKHIVRVLFHESLICCVVSVITGLVCGALFYKLASLAICKLLMAEIIAGFYYVTPGMLIFTGAIFIAIDVFTYIINCISIYRLKPVELLSSAHTGEKEPRVKWVLLVLGLLTLGAGYYFSLTTSNPLDAIAFFFIAVILVIIGTYFLFTAGSIFVLKALKRNERYYYRPGHVTAVSGLIYRMKQNAVGLASVAILATGVLVMISSTLCLYTRTEQVLEKNFPQHYYLYEYFNDGDNNPVAIPEDKIAAMVQTSADKNGLKIKDACSMEYLNTYYVYHNGELITEKEAVSQDEIYSGLCSFVFITEQTYVKLGGEVLNLAENEIALCPMNVSSKLGDSASITLHGTEYTVAERPLFFPVTPEMVAIDVFCVVIADDNVMDTLYLAQREAYGETASELENHYCVTFENRNKALEVGRDFDRDVKTALEQYIRDEGYDSYSISYGDSVWEARENLYGMYGTLLFLGILLGMVCLFATVLVIYYKQISEGYEDRNRYQIMQKIGMTKQEVKSTIRSQILLVFFLPLVTAGVHTAFAYPLLSKLLRILMLENPWLFAKWCIIVYVAFAAVYALIYSLTAKTYYKIVY